MKNRLIIGTRGSSLALAQTQSVLTRIGKIYPELKFSITKIVTAGDRDRRTRLEQMDIAVFVKELEQALIDKRIDMAVHSLKDVPVELPAGLQLTAVVERENPQDVLVAKAKLDELPPGARIGTGSLRRAIQLKRYRSDLEICNIRGNIDTRLKKVFNGEIDGVVTAAAALVRLGWTERITDYLPLNRFLPEAGQGALVIESRSENPEITRLVSRINHNPTWQSVMAERTFLKELGGGCRAPIASLGRVEDDILKLEGMVASLDGKTVIQSSEEGQAIHYQEIGSCLAARMLDMGAGKFIDEVKLG